jgi:hypothetical protein
MSVEEITYSAYCLSCDTQLGEVEVSTHNCWKDQGGCLCELCGCGAKAQYRHLCAYCDGAHPEYHINDCLECEGEL